MWSKFFSNWSTCTSSSSSNIEHWLFGLRKLRIDTHLQTRTCAAHGCPFALNNFLLDKNRLFCILFLVWLPFCVFVGLPIVSCSLIKSTTRMLVTFGICLKQYFDTRYLVFYNPPPPRMFLSLDFLWEYRIQHGANGPLYVTPSYSTWIFCRGVSGFATDCPCGVWCRGLTTCLLHVGSPFGNRILNNSWAVGLT